MTATPDAGKYVGFADLAAAQVEGQDFQVVVEGRNGSPACVVAPHGGKIEAHTSAVARSISGKEFNLYLLEGIRATGNYLALHLTSSRFDEPRCLDLVRPCKYVVTVHGCSDEHEEVLLGGLDERLKAAICEALAAAGINARSHGHPFPGTEPTNICNRGLSGMGVQLEIPLRLRQSASGRRSLANAVRQALGAASGIAVA